MGIPTMPWSTLRVVGSAPLMKFTVIAPFLPYILAFIDYLMLAGLDMAQIRRPPEAWAQEASFSLHLFYFGGTILGIASGLYLMFCPEVIKKYKDGIAYAEREVSMTSANNAPSASSSRLKIQYSELDLSRIALRRSIASLYFLGFLLVLIPPTHRFVETITTFTLRLYRQMNGA